MDLELHELFHLSEKSNMMITFASNERFKSLIDLLNYITFHYFTQKFLNGYINNSFGFLIYLLFNEAYVNINEIQSYK